MDIVTALNIETNTGAVFSHAIYGRKITCKRWHTDNDSIKDLCLQGGNKKLPTDPAPPILRAFRDCILSGMKVSSDAGVLSKIETADVTAGFQGREHEDCVDGSFMVVLTLVGQRIVTINFPDKVTRVLMCTPGHIYAFNAFTSRHSVMYGENSKSILFRWSCDPPKGFIYPTDFGHPLQWYDVCERAGLKPITPCIAMAKVTQLKLIEKSGVNTQPILAKMPVVPDVVLELIEKLKTSQCMTYFTVLRPFGILVSRGLKSWENGARSYLPGWQALVLGKTVLGGKHNHILPIGVAEPNEYMVGMIAGLVFVGPSQVSPTSTHHKPWVIPQIRNEGGHALDLMINFNKGVVIYPYDHRGKGEVPKVPMAQIMNRLVNGEYEFIDVNRTPLPVVNLGDLH